MALKIVFFSCLVAFISGFEDKTVIQYLQDNNYLKLVEALTAAGLTGTLAGSGPYTIFAPTDTALSAFNVNDYTKEQLAKLMRYHIVAEFVLVPMLNVPTNKTTLEAQSIALTPSPSGILINGNARISTTHNDIIVNNGVIQPIDMLLTPPVFIQHNIYQILLRDSDFADLTLALLLADLVSTL
ncbi:uncharacterized protein sll1735-like [Ruditapes philippinarum]|uniref:uncharacterized protein sll1735-like n=1 Tax=Ruditapes philippinarum TaxID=129788 RepID=UPI00295AC34D|nr:uncharacterized protein sll1735-like [Ruditapes philippinarum]